MKKDRDHLVPISTQVKKLLLSILEYTEYSPYVFPSERSSDNPISKNLLTNRLRSLGYPADVVSAHGFRTTASTILHEMAWEHDVVETQLAHITGTTTSRSYNRAIHLPKRKKMMQDWSDYLEKLKHK